MSDIESIKVTVLGKPIPLRVKESEVENTRNIAAYVDEQLRLFRNQFANQPDSTIKAASNSNPGYLGTGR